jgi:cell division septal protein FtsQ
MEQRYRPKRSVKSRSRFEVATNSLQAKRIARVSDGDGAPLPFHRGLIVGVLLVALLVLFVVWFLGEDFRVHDILVQNNQGVPVQQIKGASGLMSEHILFVDLNTAAKRIEALPGVNAAQVSCTWKIGCEILVQPSIGIAMWQSTTDSANKVWSDEQGRVQKALGETPVKVNIKVEDGSTPVLGAPIDDKLSRAIKELLVIQPTVTRYSYTSQYGLMFTDSHGWKVRLGVAEHDGIMRDKLTLMKEISDQLTVKKLTPKVIDVRFVEAPFYEK